jgi:general secretion pathway protein G
MRMNMKKFQVDEICASIRGGRRIKHSAFTLTELIVSIAILGILSGIAYPLYAKYKEESMIVRGYIDIQNISAGISNYFVDHGQYPDSLTEAGYATLLDPWGNPYKYLIISTAKKGDMRKDKFLVPINTDYDLYSMGKDGKTLAPLTAENSRDDIVRANNGAYIGLASDF